MHTIPDLNDYDSDAVNKVFEELLLDSPVFCSYLILLRFFCDLKIMEIK